MASRLLSLSVVSAFVASCCFEGSLGLRLPGRRGVQLAKRDLADQIQNTIFSTGSSSGLFILIDVEGFPIPVQIDLASADLYISGYVPGSDEFASTSTEADITLSFLNPPVQGNFAIKEDVSISIGGQTTLQSFALDPTNNTGLQADFPGNPSEGVLGFGPSPLSAVANSLKTGHSPLDQLYISNTSSPFSTILFAGFDEAPPTSPDPLFSGFFSVGAPVDLNKIFPGAEGISDLPDLTKITSQPAIHLGSVGLSNSFAVSQITVSGKSVPLSSTVQGAAANTAVGVLTSTEPYSVVPIEIAQAIYASVPGVSFDDGSGVYTVPCNTEISITVQIGSVTIPLDPTSVVIQDATSNTCVGSFRANKAAATPGYDVSFGTSFFPNVYILIGYNSVSGQTLSDPIIKLLPITNVTSAHQYFTNSRTNSSVTLPPIGTSAPAGAANENHAASTTFTTVTNTHVFTTVVWVGGPPPSSSPASSSDDKAAGALDLLDTTYPTASSSSSSNDDHKWEFPTLIALAGLLGATWIGIIIFALLRRRRGAGAMNSAYRNIHNAENSDYSKSLYAHDDEPSAKYSDPYSDRA